MANWTSDELDRIGKAEELKLESVKRDGTLRQPVTIWLVRVGDDLYVRAVNGSTGPWFRSTQVQHEGRIHAGGVNKDVTFVGVDVDSALNNQIDAEYRNKYRRYSTSIVGSVLTSKSRAATLKLLPRA